MDRSASHHRSHPEISVFEHVRSKKKLLYEWLSTKKKIYLDTCYWINVLNARQGTRKSIPIYSQIADLLEEHRQRDIIVCPASFPLVIEILKQRDPETLLQSASLIDKLSCGVCLQNSVRITELEFINSLEKHIFGDDTSLDAYAYWTKILFVAGELIPKPETKLLDPNEINLLQKFFFDFEWEISFAEIIDSVGFSRPPLDDLATWANQRNQTKKSAGLISFADARTEEMSKLLSQVIPRLEHVFAYLKERFTRSGRRTDDVPIPKFDPNFAPSVQILGNLFAAMRSSPRRYYPNDYIDFEHGSLALPYCEAFFCDRRFFNILTNKPLELHRVYAARISHKPEDLVAYLQSI